jgi:hypothetical protein
VILDDTADDAARAAWRAQSTAPSGRRAKRIAASAINPPTAVLASTWTTQPPRRSWPVRCRECDALLAGAFFDMMGTAFCDAACAERHGPPL